MSDGAYLSMGVGSATGQSFSLPVVRGEDSFFCPVPCLREARLPFFPPIMLYPVLWSEPHLMRPREAFKHIVIHSYGNI